MVPQRAPVAEIGSQQRVSAIGSVMSAMNDAKPSLGAKPKLGGGYNPSARETVGVRNSRLSMQQSKPSEQEGAAQDTGSNVPRYEPEQEKIAAPVPAPIPS